jgi:hypothetical protein
MNLKFHDGYAKLQNAVALDEDLHGYWHEQKNGRYQYRTAGGGILNYWRKTGAITFQGNAAVREKLKQAVMGTNE